MHATACMHVHYVKVMLFMYMYTCSVHVHYNALLLHVHAMNIIIEYFTQCGSSPDGEELLVDP